MFTEYFPLVDIEVLASALSRFFHRVAETSVLRGTAAGLFGDFANALSNFSWISQLSNWENSLRHLLAHLFALPMLGMEKLVEDTYFMILVDNSAVESLRKHSSLTRINDFVLVLTDFCYAVDAWMSPTGDESNFLMCLQSVQGWAREIEYLESMIGKRSKVEKAGCITFKSFNKRVMLCDLRKTTYAISGPYALIVSEACARLRAIKKAQQTLLHPDMSTPFVLAITGKAGTGKSEIARVLGRHLLRLDPEFEGMSDDDLNGMIYATTPTSKWTAENYSGEVHQVYMADEVGTILSQMSPIHPSLLKMMEHGAHMTDQASVELKGKVPFTSKIIILMTNSPMFGLDHNPKETGVYNKEAWFRRLTCHIHTPGLRDGFAGERSAPSMTCPKTLDVAKWQLMENRGAGNSIAPTPVCDSAGNPQLFQLHELISVVEKRYYDVKRRGVRSSDISAERFDSYYRCLGDTSNVDGVPRVYECECCVRCPLCFKTEKATGVAVCGTECTWHSPMSDDSPTSATSAGLLHPQARSRLVEQYGFWTGHKVFLSLWVKCAVIESFPFFATGISMISLISFSGLYSLAALCFTWSLAPFSPVGLALTGVMAMAMCIRPVNFSNELHTQFSDAFNVIFEKLPIGWGLPLGTAYYVSQVLRLSCALGTGVIYSSLYSYASFAYVNVLLLGHVSFTGTIFHVTTMLYYTYTCFFGFVESSRYFGRNDTSNSWYADRKLRELGLDPEKVKAAFLMLIAFISFHALAVRLKGDDAGERVEEAEPGEVSDSPPEAEVTRVISAGKVITPLQVPFYDVVCTKESMWGSKTESIKFSTSQIPLDLLILKVKANMVRLGVETFTGAAQTGGFFIHSNLIITVYHSLSQLLQKGACVYAKAVVNGEFTEIMPRCAYTSLDASMLPSRSAHVDDTNDLVVFSTEGSARKSLRKYVARSNTLAVPFKAVLIFMTKEGETQVVRGSARVNRVAASSPDGELMYTAPQFLFLGDTPFDGFLGMCGGALIAHTTTHCSIVGVIASITELEHASGTHAIGCLPLLESKLDRIDEKFGHSIPLSFPDEIRQDSVRAVTVSADFEPGRSHYEFVKEQGNLERVYGATQVLGWVPGSVVYPQTRTQWYGVDWSKDVFRTFPEFKHDNVPPKFRGVHTEEGFLSPGRHAIEDLRGEMAHPMRPFFELAVRSVLEERWKYIGLYDLYVPLPYDGDVSWAFSGLAGSVMHQGIKRTTGAGFPFAGDKADYFDYNEDETIRLKPEMKEQVDALISAMESGRRQTVVTRGTYKDEPRSLEKVQKRKIRLFAPYSLDTYLAHQVIMEPLVQISVLARRRNMTLGGMSVFSEEFADIRRDRESTHPHVILGDFSKFDKRTSHQVLYATRMIDFACIREGKWFKSLSCVEAEAFTTYFMTAASDASNALLIVDGEMLNPGHSTSSGGPDTYSQNCSTHKIIARECALIIVFSVAYGMAGFLDKSRNPEKALELSRELTQLRPEDRLGLITQHVDFITHGDDGMYAVTDQYIDLFNFHSFKKGYEQMNLVFTDPEKTLGSSSHVSWDDASIGKRTFRWDASLSTYTAPLSQSSLGKMLTIGVVQSLTIEEKRELAVNDVLLEFAQYGQEKYDEWVGKLQVLCDKHGVKFTPGKWFDVVTSNRSARKYYVRSAERSIELERAMAYVLPNQEDDFSLPDSNSRIRTPDG
jgi:hypothetical protein